VRIMGKKDTKHINVEIAPAVLAKLEAYLQAYNEKPDRPTSKLKYTDVINAALDSFFKFKGVANGETEEKGKQGKEPERKAAKKGKGEKKG
jgi:hypothetical protein